MRSFYFWGNFRKNKPNVMTFQYVVKLHRFALRTKNSHHVVHMVFKGKYPQFKYIIILCLFKVATKFRYAFKVRRLLHTVKIIVALRIDFARMHQKFIIYISKYV